MSRKRVTEYLVVPFEIKSVDDEAGTFEGIANVTEIVDRTNDVMHKGAFTRTLNSHGGKVPILWMHSACEPVGMGIDATDVEGGLAVKGRIDLATQIGREKYSGVKMGYIRSLSIGFNAIKWYMEGDIRHLTEVKLIEYSLVTTGFEVSPGAEITAIKADAKVVDAHADISEALSRIANMDEADKSAILETHGEALRSLLGSSPVETETPVDGSLPLDDTLNPAVVAQTIAQVEGMLATL